MTQPVQSRRFALIDAMRGLGALAIACHHIHLYSPQRELVDGVLPGAVQCLLRDGRLGVQMFWVIAGFVLAYSLRKARFSPAAMGNFAARRVLRLGMPYWTAVLLTAALVVAAGFINNPTPPDEDLGWAKLAANLVFLQDILGLGNISAGTWFVCVDLQLGLAAAALLWLGHAIAVRRPAGGNADLLTLTLLVAPLGLAAMFWFNLDEDRYGAWIIYYFHLPLLGMLAWWALEERVPRWFFWGFAALLAAAACQRWLLDLESKKILDIIVALAAGLTIYAAGRRGHLDDWLSAGWLQFFGRISYSLFLIHYPVSWIVLSAGNRLTGDCAAAAVAWLVAALAASIGAAQLLYVLVEAPSLRLCAKLKAKAS